MSAMNEVAEDKTSISIIRPGAATMGGIFQKHSIQVAAAQNNSNSSNIQEVDLKSIQAPSPTSVTSTPKTSISHNDVIQGCQKLLTSPKAQSQVNTEPPLLYVGIILHRPNQDLSTPFSWGISMVKERSHVHIVGITPSNGATIDFCRVSKEAPSPSIVYNISPDLRKNGEGYESSLRRLFPPPWKTTSSHSPSILTPSLQLGDAILSINGVSVSSFDSIVSVANYIRNSCTEKMMIVALRHHAVWKAGFDEISRNTKVVSNITQAKTTEQKQQQQHLQQMIKANAAKEKKERVKRVIREEWSRIQRQNYAKTVKRKLDYSEQNMGSKRPKLNPLVFHQLYAMADIRQLTNPAFKDSNGNPVAYCDNNDYHPDDGKRLRLFVSKDVKRSFNDWLKVRKATWRSTRRHIYIPEGNNDIALRDEPTSVPHDFWLSSGYESFDQWLSASKAKWRRSYSWHKDKKMKLQQTLTEKEVHFPSTTSYVPEHEQLDQFNDWLGVRKQQWRINRRKRQLERDHPTNNDTLSTTHTSFNGKGSSPVKSHHSFARLSSTNDTMIIDEILEDQQRQEKEQAIDHAPLDITWIFDSDMGAPDDVVFLLMRFLNPSDHGNLLCLNWASNYSFKKRDAVWRSLCPKRWILPRRPRKSWCVMYISKIRAEEEAIRQQSDALLTKADSIIFKGDNLNKLQKLIQKAEKDLATFDVNYTSGTVLERNSLLNMAVIHERKNIAKWLVEEKGADIETIDRGCFTPLINAAWNGDKYLVRYLLGKGADRKKIGTFHSSKGIASKEFDGMNAEGWARERGHTEVADLISIGL